MQGKTHMVGGIVIGVVGNQLLLQPTLTDMDSTTKFILAGGFIGASIIGSLYPDADHQGSFMGKRLIISNAIFRALGGVEKRMSKKAPMFAHRGILHTPLFVLLVTLLLSLLVPAIAHPIVWGFGIGMLSHILLDMLTTSGVPVLFPLTRKKISLLPFKTGGTFEKIFYYAMWIGLAYFIIKTF